MRPIRPMDDESFARRAAQELVERRSRRRLRAAWRKVLRLTFDPERYRRLLARIGLVAGLAGTAAAAAYSLAAGRHYGLVFLALFVGVPLLRQLFSLMRFLLGWLRAAVSVLAHRLEASRDIAAHHGGRLAKGFRPDPAVLAEFGVAPSPAPLTLEDLAARATQAIVDGEATEELLALDFIGMRHAGDFAEAASVLYTPEELEEMARRRGVASSAVLHWLETDPYSFAELALEGVTPPGRNSDLSPVTHYLLCAVDRMEDEDPAFVLGLAAGFPHPASLEPRVRSHRWMSEARRFAEESSRRTAAIRAAASNRLLQLAEEREHAGDFDRIDELRELAEAVAASDDEMLDRHSSVLYRILGPSL